MNTKNLACAAMVAATIAGCCDKKECKPADAEQPAAKEELRMEEQSVVEKTAPKADPNEVVAKIGDAKLTRGELDATIDKAFELFGAEIPAAQREMQKHQMTRQFVQQFIFESALAQKAKALGYSVTDEELEKEKAETFKKLAARPDAPKSFEEFLAKNPAGKEAALRQFVNGLVIDKMIRAEVLDKLPAEDHSEEAKTIIARIEEDNKSVLSDEGALAKIKELKAQLDAAPAEAKAELFGKLAEENSACPSGKSAKGSLGEFGHGQMVPEFDKAAFALEVGAISEPVKTQFGYHLIMTTAKPSDDKVTASHILIKTGEKRKVPTVEEINEYYKRNASRMNVNNFVMEVVAGADVTTAPEFEGVVPPKPAAPKAEAPKAEENSAEPVESATEK